MELRIHTFQLPLRHEFTISRESTTVQDTLVVELADGGQRGFGEATTNDYYGFTLDSMRDALAAVQETVESFHWTEPTQLWSHVAGDLSENPFALCALDQAAHDLWGKREGKRVYELWQLDPANNPASDYTIGIAEIDVMVAKMNEFPDWPIYKIKLGTDHDIEIVRELRKHTSAVFRVDANCAWGADETIANSKAMKELGVEFIEQPMAADRWEDMKRVFSESALPVIADESCIVEADVSRCQGHFHGVNVKLVKCGGLTPARRMITEAKELGMKAMVGCMTESSVGISAIAQLLPLLDYVDMDGAVLLAEDIAKGVELKRGLCDYGDLMGNGVELL